MRSSHGQATDPTEVGTGLAASPGIPPSPIAWCMAYSGATRFVRYTSDHCHPAVCVASRARSGWCSCQTSGIRQRPLSMAGDGIRASSRRPPPRPCAMSAVVALGAWRNEPIVCRDACFLLVSLQHDVCMSREAYHRDQHVMAHAWVCRLCVCVEK